MRMQFKVKYADGREVEATAGPGDIVEYERKYKTSFMLFGQGTPMEHLYFLAWAPLHRTSQDTRAFEAFLNDIDAVESVDEAPPVPTEPAASDG